MADFHSVVWHINFGIIHIVESVKHFRMDDFASFQVNDYIVKVNTESLRNVTNSKARAILKRTNLIGTQCKFVL